MLPARAALVPVFKRLLQVKLNRVDQLAVAALHHHLVAAEIRSRQQLKVSGHAIELQAVILPDVQNVSTLRLEYRLADADVFEDRIGWLGDAYVAILILQRPRRTLLVLF